MEYMSQEVYEANKLLERVQLEQEKGYYPSKIGRCNEKWWIYLYIIVGLLPIIGIYGTIMLIYCGWPNLQGKTILRCDSHEGYLKVPDNRYKEGYRLEKGAISGDMVVVNPYNDEIEPNKAIGRKFVYTGVALFIFRIVLIIFAMATTR